MSLLSNKMITLWPKFSFIDKITKINVVRLKPLRKITLGARVVGDIGQVFDSHAHFIVPNMARLMFVVNRLLVDLTAEFQLWDSYGA